MTLPATTPWLSVRDVSVRFGGNHAVDNASLDVRAGELVGLIGTNGAGKSTLMNAIGGFVPAGGVVRGARPRRQRPARVPPAPGRAGPRLPSGAAVPGAHGARDDHGGARSAGAFVARPVDDGAPAVTIGRTAQARRGVRADRLPRPRALRRRVRVEPVDRHPPDRGAGDAARRRRARVAARRTDRRRRTTGSGGVRATHRAHPARARCRDAGDRARHAAHHGDLRSRLLPRSRAGDRRGTAGGDPRRPPGHRVVPRHERTFDPAFGRTAPS